MAVASGEVFRVKIGDVEIGCQLDSTFNSDANLTANAPCKGTASKAQTNTVSSTSWSITFNGKTLLEAAGTAQNQLTILQAQQAGTPVEVSFASNLTSDGSYNMVITGMAYISNVSIEAPQEGESTYSATFTGTGEYTAEMIEVEA